MRLHGWCERCHKFRLVRVSNRGMAMLAAKGMPVGVCDSCRDEEDARQARPREGE